MSYVSPDRRSASKAVRLRRWMRENYDALNPLLAGEVPWDFVAEELERAGIAEASPELAQAVWEGLRRNQPPLQ